MRLVVIFVDGPGNISYILYGHPFCWI